MNVSRRSLIFGLSYALDIAGKNNLSHSKSTAYLSVSIGRELGFNESKMTELYYAALLHDIALSNSYDMLQHCIDGERLVRNLPLPEGIAESIHYHHELYDGSGEFGLSGESIPKGAHIICFASAFDDIFGKMFDKFDRSLFLQAHDWLEANKPLYSEDIKNAFDNLMKRESFLLDYFNNETRYTLLNKFVIDDDTCYGYDDVLKYAYCFAGIIDCKSPFTSNHSHGIAELARKAVTCLGYSDEIQNEMYIAGLLHDIGKLHVPVDILHKNDKLTPEERFEINKHTYYTRKILEQIDGFEKIVNYAANHHEKLDGTGYPYRIPDSQLSELEKIMAVCDVYQALTEERPYRENLPPEKVWGIIDDMSEKRHLDKFLVQKIKQFFN
ncbi:MAG: HD domain-containing protein [Chitinispirillales bacterium]|jgi:putative nucleotidyltransferase with HDIG domain|nr:HD domain-containing protein [Chitinispirillales bacterium]